MFKKLPLFRVTNFALMAMLSLFFVFISATAQTGIVGKLNFDPKVNGFSFENFTNENHNWKDDLGAEDLIRFFGVNAVCKSGTSAQNCVVKAAAREWMIQQLDGMNGGHCEGMAVASLRLASGLPFKNRIAPASFQPAAKSPFGFKLDQSIENYIAYYFVTQGFDEVAEPSLKTADAGPLAVVKLLIDSFKEGKDTYSLGFYQFKNGQKTAGHAITPFAVEDAGTFYRIHVYDNNYPGETRYVNVEKGGKQTWKYVTSTNPSEPAGEYVGNIDTKTLELTATSLRDGRCFDSPFSTDGGKAVGCGMETMAPVKPTNPTNPTTPTTPTKPVTPTNSEVDDDGEAADFFLTGDGDILIIDGSGRKMGYNPFDNKFYKEIPGGNARQTIGGKGEDMPHYTFPAQDSSKPYVIVFSGKHNDDENYMDFVFSSPGFTVGFDGIRLDPNEVLVAVMSADGETLEFLQTGDGEMPEVYFAVDTPKKSYKAVVEISGTSKKSALPPINSMAQLNSAIEKQPSLTVKFDDETGKLQVTDDDEDPDKYDVDFTDFDATGKERTIELNDLGGNDEGEDSYEIEFGDWDGGDDVEVKHDDEGNGFEDDEEEDVDGSENEGDDDDGDGDMDDADGDGEDDEDGEDEDGDSAFFSFRPFDISNLLAKK